MLHKFEIELFFVYSALSCVFVTSLLGPTVEFDKFSLQKIGVWTAHLCLLSKKSFPVSTNSCITNDINQVLLVDGRLFLLKAPGLIA